MVFDSMIGMRSTQLRSKIGVLATILLVTVAGAVSAGGSNEAIVPEADRDDGVFRIVTTTTQAADLARIVAQGANGVEIVALMGAGVDPHLYQPTEADVRAISRGDVLVYSGLHLEGQFDAVFEALEEQGVPVYALSGPVRRAGFVIGAFDPEAAQLGSDDPHFWFHPRNWEITVLDFAETMATLTPANAAA